MFDGGSYRSGAGDDMLLLLLLLLELCTRYKATSVPVYERAAAGRGSRR